MLERDGASLRHFLHEIAEAADAVLALRERRVELQQRALQQPELRRDFAFRKNFERTLDERQRLRNVARSGSWRRTPGSLCGSPAAAADEILVGDELVAVLLHRRAGELPAADNDHLPS